MNKAVRRISVLAGLLACGLLVCTMARAADSERAELGAQIQRWTAAVNARDVATLTATMTEDVELLDGTTTATGRDAAIRALLADTRGRVAVAPREITIAHDVAWQVVALAQVQKNGDVHASGQAIEIWKRVQGDWKLHRRITAGIGVAGGLLSRPPTGEPVLDRPKR